MIKILQMLNHDPDFRRGFRRGAGLALGGWIIMQILVCVLWPVVR
jgi:hypothetical protein